MGYYVNLSLLSSSRYLINLYSETWLLFFLLLVSLGDFVPWEQISHQRISCMKHVSLRNGSSAMTLMRRVLLAMKILNLKKTIETSNRRRFSSFTSGYLLSRNSKWYMILLVKTMASDAERFCRNTVRFSLTLETAAMSFS